MQKCLHTYIDKRQEDVLKMKRTNTRTTKRKTNKINPYQRQTQFLLLNSGYGAFGRAPLANLASHARIKRGCLFPHPLENHETIEFPSNTGPDPRENHKANKPVFNVGPPSVPQQKWRFSGGPLMSRLVLFGSFLHPSSTKYKKKKRKKNLIRVEPSLTKLSGSAHPS